MSVKVGDRVKARSANGTFIIEGVVTQVYPDGRFKLKNNANYERTMKPSSIVPNSTPSGDRKDLTGHLKATQDYMKKWAAEGNGDD